MYLRYIDPDDTVQHTSFSDAEIEEEFRLEDMARVFIVRDTYDRDDFNLGQTRIWIVEDTTTDIEDALFGGILEDIDTSGAVHEFICESFERLGKDAEPTAGGDRRENVHDDDTIKNMIDSVDDLTEGTIERVSDTLHTWVFSHASQAKVGRTVEEATSGELKYNPDMSVDYAHALGSDRTNETIGPAEQNITDGHFDVDRKGSGMQLTHLRVVGAGEGQHQLFVNVVPDDDPETYENEVRVTTDWEDGDLIRWGPTVSNKDIINQDVLEDFAETLYEEYRLEDPMDVETTINGVDNVELGDEFHVFNDADDVDENLRVVQVTTIIDKEGIDYRVILSNRKHTRRSATDADTKDVSRYNLAFEGDAVWATPGGSRQPVGDGVNYRMDFRMPNEVEYLHRFKLQVIGFPYRFYASPEEHDHTVTIPDHTHPVEGDSHSHNLNMDPHAHDIEYEDEDSVSWPTNTHRHRVEIDTETILSTEHELLSRWGNEEALQNTGAGNWTSLGTMGINGADYEFIFVNIIATRPHAPARARIRSIQTGDSFPLPDGVVLWGTSPPGGDPDNGGWGTGAATFSVPKHIGDVVVEYWSQSSEGNIMFEATVWQKHEHSVFTIETSEVASSIMEQFTTGGIASATTTGIAVASGGGAFLSSGESVGMIAGVEDTAYEPTDVSVLINGVEVETEIGSGSFETEVDLLPHAEHLNMGGWNSIELTSTTLGHLQCQADIDCYRQILGGG